MSYHLSPDSPGEQGTAPPYEAEIQRAKGRREGFKVVRPEGHDDEQWALAFSGGGSPQRHVLPRRPARPRQGAPSAGFIDREVGPVRRSP